MPSRPTSPEAGAPAPLIWDLPTRLFHWLLALLVVAAFITANVGGNWIEWHFRAGYAILTLLLFRLAWGFAGGRHARFSSFPLRPAAIRAYLRGGLDSASPGHNPLGSLSVVAMLLAIAVQVGLGLFSNDDIASEGPLAVWVSKDTSDFLTSLHHINRFVVLALVVLHIAAIAWYRLFGGRNLVTAMITGRDPELPLATASSRDDIGSRLTAAVIVAVAGVLVWLLVR